jgi:hypothetical protein
MDFGSGNGFGRKQKMDAYGDTSNKVQEQLLMWTRGVMKYHAPFPLSMEVTH